MIHSQSVKHKELKEEVDSGRPHRRELEIQRNKKMERDRRQNWFASHINFVPSYHQWKKTIMVKASFKDIVPIHY